LDQGVHAIVPATGKCERNPLSHADMGAFHVVT
jgi:hypothetical protein